MSSIETVTRCPDCNSTLNKLHRCDDCGWNVDYELEHRDPDHPSIIEVGGKFSIKRQILIDLNYSDEQINHHFEKYLNKAKNN